MINIKHTMLISTLVLAGIALVPAKSLGQVDATWLKNWNEGHKKRPLALASSGRIAAKSEPGIPMLIHGQVLAPDGTEAAGVVVHATHRDRNGFDFGPNDNTLSTWRLQGWTLTDAKGRFEFASIRPAADHLGREAAHIHFTLDSADFGRQWAPSFFLSDDPLITARQRRQSELAGKHGRVIEVRTVDDKQHVEVRIKLKPKADF